MANGTGGAGAPQEEDRRRATRRKRFRIFGVALGVIGAGAAIGWFITRNDQSTDDAFIEAYVVQIAPQVGGLVASVHVGENQRVEAGQALIDIDTRDLDVAQASARAGLEVARAAEQSAQADLDLTRSTTGAAVDQARQAVEQARQAVEQSRHEADAAEADSVRAEADVVRYRDLAARSDASRQRLEQAVADARATGSRARAARTAVNAQQAALAQAEARLRDALAAPQRLAVKEAALTNARAQRAQADAALRSADNNLAYAHLTAPAAGRIGRRAVNPGDVVQRNQILGNLVLDPPWVVANFKETQLTRMRPGQPARLHIDAFPDHPLTGRVQSIQPGSGARFSLLPPENATGNFVKVVQRVPVKIVFDDPSDPFLRRLSAGMSVVPTVDVGVEPSPGAEERNRAATLTTEGRP